MFKKTQDNQNILKMMSTGLNLITRSNFSGNQLITQLPLLLRICQPSIRSVNPALWSKNEKGKNQYSMWFQLKLKLFSSGNKSLCECNGRSWTKPKANQKYGDPTD